MANTDKKNLTGYLIFWGGQLASMAGSNVVTFSLTWWITVVTGSPFMLGLSAFFGFGSYILATPIAGVFVDRWSRKKVIVVSDSLLAMVNFFLLVLFALGQANIVHVLIIQLIGGPLGAFHQSAADAIVPLMIPKKHLSRINSFQYLSASLIQTVGPAIGALVYAFFLGDMARILWIDVGTYIIAVIPTIFIFIPALKPKAKTEKISFSVEFREGFSFIRQRPGLLTLLSVFTAANFLMVPTFVLLPLFSQETLALGDQNLAVIMLAGLMSFQNLSMLAASLFMSVWKGFKKNTLGVILGLSIGAIGLIVLGFTPPGLFWFAAAGILLVGLTIPIANIASQTIWQSVVPPEKIGRVFSVRTTIAQFTGPIAMLVAGTIAEYLNIPFIFILFGSMLLAFLLYTWFMTSLPQLETDLANKQSTDKKLDETKPDEESGRGVEDAGITRDHSDLKANE